jgi:hypothetical protein
MIRSRQRCAFIYGAGGLPAKEVNMMGVRRVCRILTLAIFVGMCAATQADGPRYSAGTDPRTKHCVDGNGKRNGDDWYIRSFDNRTITVTYSWTVRDRSGNHETKSPVDIAPGENKYIGCQGAQIKPTGTLFLAVVGAQVK